MTLEEYNHYYSQPIVKHMTLTFNDLSDPNDSDIVLTNSEICSEKLSLEESLCSGSEDLNLGACEASCFKVRVVNSGSFKGKTVVVSQSFTDKEGRLVTHTGDYVVDHLGRYIIVLTASGEVVNVPCGTYKVFSDKPSNDRMWRDLVCYDAMYDILNADVKDWYEALTFPMTIKNLRDSFFTYLGITQVTTTLINDSLSIMGGFVAEGELSGKTIIESICQLNGVFGHINREGKMDYISLPNTDSIEYEWYVDGTGSYEDYVTSSITKIIARKENNDVGTQVGTDGNTWVIENNPLIFGIEGTQALTDALTSLLQIVSTITYRPFQVTTYGIPALPLGTHIQLNTRSQTINSIVMNRTLNGIQGMTDDISATGNKERVSVVNSFNSQIQRTKGKVHLLEVDLDTFKSEVSSTFETVEGEIEANTSLINQTADAIELEVSGVRSRTEYNLSPSYWSVDTRQNPNRLVIHCSMTLAENESINLDGRHFVLNLPTKLPRNSATSTAVDFYPFTAWKNLPKVLDISITTSFAPIALSQLIYYNGDIVLTDQGTDGSTLHLSYFFKKAFPVTGSDPTTYSQFTGFWVGADDSYNQAVTARSEISMTNTQIVMKVEATTGKMVLVQLGLGADDQSATEFKVEADNIDFIANDTIQLTSNNLSINSTKFQVTSAGAVTCSDLTVSGGSININNKFEVDSSGNCYIDGGSININNKFEVDSNGNCSIDGGSINIAGTTYNFKVNANGTIEANMQNLTIANTGAVSCSALTITDGSITIPGTDFKTKIQPNAFSVVNNVNSGSNVEIFAKNYDGYNSGYIIVRGGNSNRTTIDGGSVSCVGGNLIINSNSRLTSLGSYEGDTTGAYASELRLNGKGAEVWSYTQPWLSKAGEEKEEGQSARTNVEYSDTTSLRNALLSIVQYLGTAGTLGSDFYLNDKSSYIVITAHNSTASLNSMWLVNGTDSSGLVVRLSQGTPTVTVSIAPASGGTKSILNVTTQASTVRVHVIKLRTTASDTGRAGDDD